MNLKTIFKKPVDRPIEGVIKADDEQCLKLEVEEYVLTNEVEKRLEGFLDAYNNYEGANGVWVSGFFGSGKSHLLKMLALLLENRQIDGSSMLDMFLPKCAENEILTGDLKRTVSIPSKSILFNIDQKADVISKTQTDALLAVFVKVFDEMCGYYGKQGHIAQFERDLDSRNLYEQFKSAYEEQAGKSWLRGREQALLESQNIAKAYANATGDDASTAVGILDKYRSEYSVSIEDFAEQVNTYIKCQAHGFRLNFFVDEVGQYIADNVKLMTNLQTVAESLATKCRGQAWVIVTAQEDMSTVVGEMGKQQGNDFSKIQARFATRMKLTSQDVAEVIQKRLLMKNDNGVEIVSGIYHTHANNLKTMFNFADGSQAYRNFKDRDHFIHCYPFIPYQFPLFQTVIQSLSMHNAFEGKHSSVGERSMLGVFQQVVKEIIDHEPGQLAAFDLMFEGIRTALKSNIQRAILQAENELDNIFAIRLLKSLFLVKYIKEFKPTVRNLCVLMLDRFNQDLPALRKQVQEALNILEQQTYIERNGELYEFLTNEEKDVEEEIKNTEVEPTDVASELERVVFDIVLRQKKIRNDNNKQDYSYARKLDDRLFGREHELAIHIISPFNENACDESVLRMQSMGRDELRVIMPPDERLMRDILMYKCTEKYIRQNISITQRDTVKRILEAKSSRNNERYSEIQQSVKLLLGKAKMIVSGNDINIGSEDAQTRIIQGFYELIILTYPNQRMLPPGILYTENDIAKCLQHANNSLFANDVVALSEAEQEMLSFININNQSGTATTIKSLLEKFNRKPYGWYYAAILCTLAKLYARGKVEVRTDGNLLEDNELELALRNTHAHGNIILEPQVEFTASQVRALKDFYGDFFDEPPQASEAKSLGQATGIALKELMHSLTPLVAQATQYPFIKMLIPVIEKLKEISGKPYSWYLSDLLKHEDELLDMKEGIIDPVRKFMSGPQRNIYDQASKFIQDQKPNFDYIEGNDAENVSKILGHKECFKGNSMQQVKSLIDQLQHKVSTKLKDEVNLAKDHINILKNKLLDMKEFLYLDDDQKEEAINAFNGFTVFIEAQTLIAVIRDQLRNFEETTYRRLLTSMVNPPASTDKNAIGDHPEPRIEYVSYRKLQIPFDKAWLADESDVEEYLDSMRKTLLKEIKQGKRVQI